MEARAAAKAGMQAEVVMVEGQQVVASWEEGYAVAGEPEVEALVAVEMAVEETAAAETVAGSLVAEARVEAQMAVGWSEAALMEAAVATVVEEARERAVAPPVAMMAVWRGREMAAERRERGGLRGAVEVTGTIR